MIYAIASLCDWFGAKRVAMRLFASAPRSDYGAWWGAVGLMQTGRDEEALRLESVRPGGRRQHEIVRYDWKALRDLYVRADDELTLETLAAGAALGASRTGWVRLVGPEGYGVKH